jgi:hypothetical protein
MEIYLFGVLVVMLVFTGATGGLGLLIYLGAPKRRPTDASHLNLAPTMNTQATIDRLVTLGFQRLGETYTRMPLAMSPGPAWIYIDASMTTHAEIVEITPSIFFTTVYEDGSVIETGFPQGEYITTPNFISQTVTTSVEDAYHLHTQSIKGFQIAHGTPKLIKGMDDYLYWDGVYRERHAQRKMRRVFYLDLAQALALLYGIVVSFIVWLLWQRHAPVPQWVTDWDRGLFILLAPAFLISVVSWLTGILGSRRNRKRVRTG